MHSKIKVDPLQTVFTCNNEGVPVCTFKKLTGASCGFSLFYCDKKRLKHLAKFLKATQRKLKKKELKIAQRLKQGGK